MKVTLKLKKNKHCENSISFGIGNSIIGGFERFKNNSNWVINWYWWDKRYLQKRLVDLPKKEEKRIKKQLEKIFLNKMNILLADDELTSISWKTDIEL